MAVAEVMNDSAHKARFDNLNSRVKDVWNDIFNTSKMVSAIRDGVVDPRLYALYMIETYHYTSHNARNQALVGVQAKGIHPNYMKFCFHHAYEETGHENLALADVKSLGLDIEPSSLPKPLPATEVLIAYLYWVASNGNPLQRLGYSFWAESSYEYINPLVDKIRSSLNLDDSQLSFFIAHSEIDSKHAEEVARIMVRHARTDEDWRDIEQVMVTSLKLTGHVLDDVFETYEAVVSGTCADYPFLDRLAS
ncbi:MAG: iron-containing redox enzyme family protein [Wenzhouxiangellaceae bacterium]